MKKDDDQFHRQRRSKDNDLRHRFMPLKAFVTRCIVAIVCFVGCGTALANCNDGKRVMGVNLSGAEYNGDKLPGVAFKDYLYPDVPEIQYFLNMGMNTIRLPILWERIQPQLFGELDQEQLQKIMGVIAAASKANACVIIDIHNYGEYRGQPIGSPAVPAEAFISLWKKMSTAFPQPTYTAFGLMNEPSKIKVADWAALAQKTILVMRKSGSRHLILVASGRWSGAHDWDDKGDGVSNAEAFQSFDDPFANSAIEVHQYADSDFSGAGNTCVDGDTLRSILKHVAQWAETSRHRLFLGEYGVATDEHCLEALDAILGSVYGNPAWIGSTYWAAGHWWGKYPLSIEPDANGDKPQINVIRKYLKL